MVIMQTWKCSVCGTQWNTTCAEDTARAAGAPCGHQGLFKLVKDEFVSKLGVKPVIDTVGYDGECPI